MESDQHSHAGMHVKGGLLRARFHFVALNHGTEAWTRIVATLPAQDRQALAEITVDNWYPLETLERVDRAIVEELHGVPTDIYDQLGEFSATTSLSGPFSSLLNPDIHSFLRQSSLIHRTYQDFGEPKYEPLSETSGLLTIKYDTPPPLSFCASGAAYFRHAIELCGARSARITHTRCRGRADAVCEFYVTWQP
ncbi:MAG TPA: hypothetical protein VJH03_17955 [Blastocatellia bacterium]|nr:hypothetical protein [Blastocatellia bacterium]